MPDLPVRVDEVEGRPVVVGERMPHLEVVIDRDRVVDLSRLHRPANVVEVMLELELRRVYADRHEPLIPVPLLPGAVVRLRAHPVAARVRPKLNDYDTAAQA